MTTSRAKIVCAGLLLGFTCAALAQTHSPNSTGNKEAIVAHATGSFEVKITPQSDDFLKGTSVGRMSIDKQLHGDLEGTSKGEMLTGGDIAKGSAGYVAIEQVTGTLNGRSGSFILQHNGTMTRGTPQLTVSVVPDSGTGQLAGLAGTMTIKITDGKHFYDFTYILPESH
jgi:Protein of unknown function (DUF3224)